MRVVAIVQARMGSTRLPGKVLRDLGGKTMLARVVERLLQSTVLDEVVVATTVSDNDGAIADECEMLGVPCFRGAEDDVLDRYYHSAVTYGAQHVVRITGDCPLIDPQLVTRVVSEHRENCLDYACNFIPRTFPRGLDTEVMTMNALSRAWREATEPYERTHVTPYIYQHPELFRLHTVANDEDYSHYRWTVDTTEDLAFVQAVYGRLDRAADATWREVVTLLKSEPWLVGLNQDIQQKALQDG